MRTVPLTEDGTRIAFEARTWTARYRDANGKVVDEPTGCKDEQNARSKLADLEKMVERVKAGVVTVRELTVASLGDCILADHIDAYERSLTGAGVSVVYRKNSIAAIGRVFGDCGFVRVNELRRTAVEDWLAARIAEKMSAPSNTHTARRWLRFVIGARTLTRRACRPIPLTDYQRQTRKPTRDGSDGP